MLKGEIISLFVFFFFFWKGYLLKHKTRTSVQSDYDWTAEGPIQKKFFVEH